MGKRPDYAVVVYCNLIRQTYKDVPILIGGIEASLRRLAHYDYWSNKVKRSILLDSQADLLMYGMGEHSVVEIAEALDAGIDVLLDIEVQGAAKVRAKCPEAVLIFIIPPSFEELSRRLRGRNTDSEETIAGRLQKAREEYQQIPNYDYLVVNDKVSAAAAEIIAILLAEDCRTRNRLHLVEGI